MTIKWIAGSSDLCSARGNDRICLQVFSMAAEGEAEPREPIHGVGAGGTTRKQSEGPGYYGLLETLTKTSRGFHILPSDRNEPSGR